MSFVRFIDGSKTKAQFECLSAKSKELNDLLDKQYKLRRSYDELVEKIKENTLQDIHQFKGKCIKLTYLGDDLGVASTDFIKVSHIYVSVENDNKPKEIQGCIISEDNIYSNHTLSLTMQGIHNVSIEEISEQEFDELAKDRLNKMLNK